MEQKITFNNPVKAFSYACLRCSKKKTKKVRPGARAITLLRALQVGTVAV